MIKLSGEAYEIRHRGICPKCGRLGTLREVPDNPRLYICERSTTSGQTHGCGIVILSSEIIEYREPEYRFRQTAGQRLIFKDKGEDGKADA
jgi:hypothetical protein